MLMDRDQLTPEERETIRRAAQLLGRVRTPRRTEAALHALSTRGPDHMGGRPARPLSEYECTCGAGDTLDGHKTTCPRGLIIYRRRKSGRPVVP